VSLEKIFAARKVHVQDVTALMLDLARGIGGERRKDEVIDKMGSNGKMESHNLHGIVGANGINVAAPSRFFEF